MGAPEDDGLDMDTAGVLHEMATLRSDGEALSTGWSAARTTVDNNLTAMGGDLLGQTFRRIYDMDDPLIRQKADAVVAEFTAEAGVGEVSAYFYRVADMNAKNRIQR